MFAIATAALALASVVSASNGNEMGVGGYPNLMARNVPEMDKRVTSKTFGLQTAWQGANFFDGWSFFNYADPTNGMVNYLGAGDAWARNIVQITSSGTAIMTVDSWNSVAYGAHRDSVRITSNTPFKKGNLLIIDAKHMPYGCSTWPAFWTVGANWPYGGEIDIIEGANTQSTNQMTLHTAPGCEIYPGNTMAGSILQNSCDAFYNFNTGCGIKDPSTKSYGQKFNSIGGGVFATLWDNDGINVWFFARDNIPADITANAPRPSKWGKPRASFGTGNCNMDSFFGDQTIVFDITLCGDWAGATYSSQGCPGDCASRLVDPKNFLDAYWEINYVKIFS